MNTQTQHMEFEPKRNIEMRIITNLIPYEHRRSFKFKRVGKIFKLREVFMLEGKTPCTHAEYCRCEKTEEEGISYFCGFAL